LISIITVFNTENKNKSDTSFIFIKLFLDNRLNNDFATNLNLNSDSKDLDNKDNSKNNKTVNKN
jgi:hypothetical protein